MIKEYLENILAVDVNQQSNVFNYERWLKGIPNVEALQSFEKFHNSKITRKLVIEEFDSYFLDTRNNDVVKPFLLSMIWGYEGSGYGTFRTLKYFDDPGLAIKLKDALFYVSNKNIEGAFNELNKVKYLSTSFASKVLYFAAKAKKIEDYPLIFDMRAATGMVTLASSNAITQMVAITPKKGWQP